MTYTAKSPTRLLGPFETEDEAKREAQRANTQYGGPGFDVETRQDGHDMAPHAYLPEQAADGRWSVVLTRLQ